MPVLLLQNFFLCLLYWQNTSVRDWTSFLILFASPTSDSSTFTLRDWKLQARYLLPLKFSRFIFKFVNYTSTTERAVSSASPLTPFLSFFASRWGCHFVVIPDNPDHINRNKIFGKYALELETLSSLCILMVSSD